MRYAPSHLRAYHYSCERVDEVPTVIATNTLLRGLIDFTRYRKPKEAALLICRESIAGCNAH